LFAGLYGKPREFLSAIEWWLEKSTVFWQSAKQHFVVIHKVAIPLT